MSQLTSKKYWLSADLCNNQIVELVRTRKLVRFLIEENANSEEAWDNNLMHLLCEYNTHVYHMLQMMLDILGTKPVLNQKTDKEEYLLGETQGLYIKSQANLMKLLDIDLKYNYGVSFTTH
jgi:hypothetical protein|tara:strand:- start:440 stop:802 length:363 start_codon:yes stop_codon:yes gene_type:complete